MEHVGAGHTVVRRRDVERRHGEQREPVGIVREVAAANAVDPVAVEVRRVVEKGDSAASRELDDVH